MSDKPDPNEPQPDPVPEPVPHPVPDPVDPNKPVAEEAETSTGHGRVHVIPPGEVLIDGRSG